MTFAVSGMLWNRSLVMIDAPTKSLWSHLLGRAMRGKLEGVKLEVLPSLFTDWKTWKELHPKTTVAMLSRTSTHYRREFYRDPSRFVLGYSEGEIARAWPFDQMQKKPLANDLFGEDPVLVAFDAEHSTAFLFSRRVQVTGDQGAKKAETEIRVLEFLAQSDHVSDSSTGSIWDVRRGVCTAGPLKGAQLTPIPGIISYRHTWQTFYPKTTFGP